MKITGRRVQEPRVRSKFLPDIIDDGEEVQAPSARDCTQVDETGSTATSPMPDERCIRVRDVQVDGSEVVLPYGTKIVASYNWSTTSTAEEPHIIAPGTPRVYVPPKSEIVTSPSNAPCAGAKGKYVAPGRRGLKKFNNVGGFRLTKDRGDPVVDENKVRMHPSSSLDPLFYALDICSPGFDTETVDIVTDRNNLRKLLRFCDSPDSRETTYPKDDYRLEPFKFFCHPIGKARPGGHTLAFTRSITGQEKEFEGYCKNFEAKLTDNDPRSPLDTGRFSIVTRMKLDGISLLVRSKVDARLTPVQMETAPTQETGEVQDYVSAHLRGTVVPSKLDNKTNLATSASPAMEAPSATAGNGLKNPRLRSTKSGQLLGDDPQILELKTKNERYTNTINWKDFYWQMVLGSAQKLVLGLHNYGTYGHMKQLSLEEVKDCAEKAGSSSMVYLANTLREVVKAAHCLMAANASVPDSKDGKTVGPAVVVDYYPTPLKGEGNKLQVRLAVPADGAVPPSVL